MTFGAVTVDLPLIWATIIGIAVVMYVVMDGFDLGLGILFPFADNEGERDQMMATIKMFWDGNETWLIMGGVGLLVAFPRAYAILMPALNITAAQFNFSNNLDAAATIRPDHFIDGADETKRTMTGSLTVRIGTDHTIDDLVDAEGSAAMEVSFALKAQPTWKLSLAMPRVFFELSKKPVTGPGGVSASINFRCAYDAVTPAAMLTATLLNDVAAY